MNGWISGPDALLLTTVAVLVLAALFAMDYWVVRTASHLNGH